MKTKTVDAARNKWRGILVQIGIGKDFLVNKHGPCPLCGGDDRFRWDNKGGNGTYICSYCGAGDGMKLAMQYTGKRFPELAAEIDQIVGNVESDKPVPVRSPEKAKRRLMLIGKQLQQIGDLDPASRYLRSRGIKRIPRDFLRIHPALEYFEDGKISGRYPAMVAAFRRPDGHIETFHATYLTQDGQKADVPSQRKVLGVQDGLSGCAIRLSPVVAHIGIAEGIETAISVTQLYGIPCWSCYSANGVESFIPPTGVQEVTFFADCDGSFTGQAAAYSAAKRLTSKGYKADVRNDLQPGQDYNDLLMEAM